MDECTRNMKPAHAAKVLGSNAQSVRVRMQQNCFDPSIGTASRYTGSIYTYEIYPERLAAYLNISVDTLFERLNA